MARFLAGLPTLQRRNSKWNFHQRSLHGLSRHSPEDLIRLTAAIRALENQRGAGPAFTGWQNAPLNVLNCVLSLNRRYEKFCLPRVEQFAANRANIRQLADLRCLIMGYPTPLTFSELELHYRDERRADVVLGVTPNICYACSRRFQPRLTDCPDLTAKWRDLAPGLGQSRPMMRGAPEFADLVSQAFSICGCYSGCQTAKPDIHIRRFVFGEGRT